MLRRPEPDTRLFNLAIHLDENIVGPIDHDVRDVIARQKWVEWTETQQVLADLTQQNVLLDNRQGQPPDLDDFLHDVSDFFFRFLAGHLG